MGHLRPSLIYLSFQIKNLILQQIIGTIVPYKEVSIGTIRTHNRQSPPITTILPRSPDHRYRSIHIEREREREREYVHVNVLMCTR